MTVATWEFLRALLAERYEDLKISLTRQLGSEELASECLHETWLRLNRQDEAGPMPSPRAFVFRVATNIAKDRLRAERRHARGAEMTAALDVPDPAPGPARETQARLDLKVLENAIRELPKRSRDILIASRVEGLTHQAIADRLGISRRTVLYELERAAKHLAARLKDYNRTDRTS